MLLGGRRWAFLGLLAFLLILAGWALHRGELLALALPLLCYLALGFYRPLPTIELQAHRLLSARQAARDETVQVALEIQNQHKSAVLEIVTIEEILPYRVSAVTGTTEKIVTLAGGEQALLEYSVSGRRGLLRWPGVRVSVSDTLGLYHQAIELSCASELLIVPAFEKIRALAMKPRRTRIYSGQVKAHLGGPGLEFFGVRDYYPGDPQRYLNWKATARRDRPIINEFEQERVVDVIILLDARERSDVITKGDSLFEHSVEAALALTHYVSVQGNRVGLLIYGNFLNWTWPGYGGRQRERLLRALASAEKGDKAVFEDLERLPTRLLPAGSQLIFVSPLRESDMKTLLDLRLRYEILVVSPDPLAFESRALLQTPEVQLAARIARLQRTALLTHLRRAGVRLLDWDVARPLAPLVAQELGRMALRAAVMRGRR